MGKIRFEDDYIFRNNRMITSSPDIALTELVANAWDAGALHVDITLPTDEERNLCIKDDGCGMSEQEFNERWMTLNYNRTKHQGKYVVFPDDLEEKNKTRVAYGRNGVGRHGMLCFANSYVIRTWNAGKCFECTISISSGNEPFKIVSKKSYKKEGHGTEISSYASRNIPNLKETKEILSARFIYDPQFDLTINGESLTLATCDGVVKEEEVKTKDGKRLNVSIIDSTKTASSSQQHGIAFWVCGRLVGTPAWSYGRYQFLDARYRIAKRYTVIVQSEDIIDEVQPDWTGFFDSIVMDNVYLAVKELVSELVSNVMREQITDLKTEVIEGSRDELEELSLSEKREVSLFMDVLTDTNPMMATEMLKASVEALMQIQKAKKGHELLVQLSNMKPEEIDKLSDLLKSWDINDVISVIDEIDRRILVIEAIGRVYENKNTDELHTLHPMVLGARWLFGAEFDSPMFASNKSLNTVVKGLFKDEEYDVDAIANPRKRPDIVCLKKSSMRVVCTDRVDNEAGRIMKPDQILIVELKRGGSEIGLMEVAQAENYVRQIKKSGILHKTSSIHAFVVGCKIGDIDTHKEVDSGIVDVVTYGHLVDTASVKLFGLRQTLEEHYKNLDDECLVEKALKEPAQIKMRLEN